jgi:hypothetical protein
MRPPERLVLDGREHDYTSGSILPGYGVADAHARPQISSCVVGRPKPSWRHHDRGAGGCTPAYLPHAVPGAGMAASKTDGTDHHDGDRLRRPPSLVCMPAMREALRVLFGTMVGFFAGAAGALVIARSESRWSRTISRMHNLRAGLGGSANLLQPFPLRPRYMRHRTYQTLRARYMSLSRQNTGDLQGFVSRLKRRIGAIRRECGPARLRRPWLVPPMPSALREWEKICAAARQCSARRQWGDGPNAGS